jgi:hypothetical protein
VPCDLYTVRCTAIALVTKTGFGLIGWSVLLIHTLYDTLQLLQLQRQDFDYKSGCSAVASSSKARTWTTIMWVSFPPWSTLL